MVRRVKAYLKNMKVITDEDKLHAMSLECEPPIGGSSTSAAPAIQIPQPSVKYFLLVKERTPSSLIIILSSSCVNETPVQLRRLSAVPLQHCLTPEIKANLNLVRQYRHILRIEIF